MKKNRVLGLMFLAVLAGGLAAAPEPSWYRHKEMEFPDSSFVSAVGTGLNPKDAETDAMKGIAIFFKSTINAQEDLITQYEDIFKPNGKKDSKHEAKKTTILNSAVKVTTQAELRGVRFTSHWYNDQTQRWAVLGYINKHEAQGMLQNRINTNLGVIDSLILIAQEDLELLYRYNYYKTAAFVAQMVEEDLRALADVSGASPDPGILQHTRRIVADTNTLRSQLVFDVRIDDDREDRIRRKLFGVLETQGYVTAPNRGTYTIVGTISTTEEVMPAANFVRSGITLQLVNNEGSPLFSYSANYPRRGSKNWDVAYNTVFRGIEQDLESNFIAQFNAFMGN